MRKIIDLLMGTCIMWLPILALAIANWLSQIITVEMVMAAIKVLGCISLVTLLVIDIKSKKMEE